MEKGLGPSSKAPDPANASREASKRRRLRGPSRKTSGLPGLPTAACGTGSSVARQSALGFRAASPAGFGAFALLDGPGLTQFRL